MSKINEKLGLRPAGKRAFMKLPKLRADAVALTALTCPNCPHRWIIQNVIHGRLQRMCGRCSTSWYPDEAAEER